MNYELLFIVPAKYSDDEVKEINEKIISIVKDNGGSIVNTQDWGKKKLAYQINHYRHGYYTLIIFSGEPTVPEKITQKLNINTDVIRFQIVKEIKRSKPFSPEDQKEKKSKPKVTSPLPKKKVLPADDPKEKKEKVVEAKKTEEKTKDKVNDEAKESNLDQKPEEKTKKETEEPKKKEVKKKAGIDELDKKLDELLEGSI